MFEDVAHVFGIAKKEDWSVQLSYGCLTNNIPTPVAAQSKAWVCNRSLAGIEGSNTAGDMGVC
jgi:hypothetical protein